MIGKTAVTDRKPVTDKVKYTDPPQDTVSTAGESRQRGADGLPGEKQG